MDYKGLEALYTVQELQSFEAAAKKLHITQSAISQRIKGLESFYGEPLLIRSLPYRPTKLGTQLITHFKQVCLLEQDLEKQLGEAVTPHISIAINRDSLETWFLDLIEEKDFNHLTLEVIADDQELTLELLKNGLVSACLSTTENEILGGHVQYVGKMEYVLVASPKFIKTHFPKGFSKSSLLQAPAIKFDQNDMLHERYLEKFFGISAHDLNFHVIPSVRGFKKFALLGYGYGLIPKIDITEELKNKKLIQLCPDKTWQIPLYWHYFAVQSKFYQKFNQEMIHHIKAKLF